jgi:hypothetical protein
LLLLAPKQLDLPEAGGILALLASSANTSRGKVWASGRTTSANSVAADVPAGHAELASDGDHDVGEVLAAALALLQRVVDGRIDPRRFGLVDERRVNPRADVEQYGERIVAPDGVDLARQFEEQRRRLGEAAKRWPAR